MLDARFICIFHEPIRLTTRHLLRDNWLSTLSLLSFYASVGVKSHLLQEMA